MKSSASFLSMSVVLSVLAFVFTVNIVSNPQVTLADTQIVINLTTATSTNATSTTATTTTATSTNATSTATSTIGTPPILITSVAPIPQVVSQTLATGQTCVTLNLQKDYGIAATDKKTNGEVSILQAYLYARGYFNQAPTGYFGYVTSAALRQYQWDKDVKLSGVSDKATRTFINNDCLVFSRSYVGALTSTSSPATALASTTAIVITAPTLNSTYLAGTNFNLSFNDPRAGEQYKAVLILIQATTTSATSTASSTPIVVKPVTFPYLLGTFVGATSTSQTASFRLPETAPAGSYTVRLVQSTDRGFCPNGECRSNRSPLFNVTASTTATSSTPVVIPTPTEASRGKVKILSAGLEKLNQYYTTDTTITIPYVWTWTPKGADATTTPAAGTTLGAQSGPKNPTVYLITQGLVPGRNENPRIVYSEPAQYIPGNSKQKDTIYIPWNSTIVIPSGSYAVRVCEFPAQPGFPTKGNNIPSCADYENAVRIDGNEPVVKTNNSATNPYSLVNKGNGVVPVINNVVSSDSRGGLTIIYPHNAQDTTSGSTNKNMTRPTVTITPGGIIMNAALNALKNDPNVYVKIAGQSYNTSGQSGNNRTDSREQMSTFEKVTGDGPGTYITGNPDSLARRVDYYAIKISSPKEGAEISTSTSPYQIKWKFTNIPSTASVDIDLIRIDVPTKTRIVSDLSAKTDSYNWQVTRPVVGSKEKPSYLIRITATWNDKQSGGARVIEDTLPFKIK